MTIWYVKCAWSNKIHNTIQYNPETWQVGLAELELLF